MQNLDQDFIPRGENLQRIRASQGQRLLTYVIDLLLYYLLLFFLGGTLGLFSSFSGDEASFQIIVLLVFYAYYFLLEASMGKTFGKMIVGTQVVDQHGQSPTIGMIALRTLVRFVPFEHFSILFGEGGVMWHDQWSKTQTVVSKQLSA